MSTLLEALNREVGVRRYSKWLLVDQSMIDRFADATLDRQFIHVEPERAVATPFGGTVAHGFLTLSLLTHLESTISRPSMPQWKLGVNYGLDKVRFIAPVRSGSRVRAASSLQAIEEKAPGRFQQTLDVEVEIAGQEKVAMAATWHSQFTI